MNSENIYDAITDIHEDIIIEAKDHRPKKSHNAIVRRCAIAVSLVLVIGIGSLVLWNYGIFFPLGGSSSSGGGFADRHNSDGSTMFRSYAGPVFPLAIIDDASGISASRKLIFDFDGSGETGMGDRHYNDAKISDKYILSNDTGVDKTARILYPFAGSFSELERLLPVLSIDAGALQTELMAGSYSGGFTGTDTHDENLAINLSMISSWEEYVALLSDGKYLQRTLGKPLDLDQIVTVYEFANVQADHSAGVAPSLAASFSLDYDKTDIMTYRFNGADWDRENGTMCRGFFVPRETQPDYSHPHYMIVIGADINDLVIQGYKNLGLNKGEEMDVTADVKRYKAKLSDIIMLLLDDFLFGYNRGRAGGLSYTAGYLDPAMLYRASVELLCDYGTLSDSVAFRYETGMLDEVFSETLNMNRVFYLSAEIMIQAGELRFLRVGFGEHWHTWV